MANVSGLVRTASQFVYVVAVLVALPSLTLLAWCLLNAPCFAVGALLGIPLAQYASAAAVGAVTATAVAFLRPDDVAAWMPPVAAGLLMGFAGAMTLLFVLPR